ncbi:MAG: tRNA threonylcarbamoyladenosine dehydratase [Burkholderiales bacterium]|nr:tRNA threonylcarbamoyladenosine dehydratase [Burkholderiales bacterium]
MSIDHPIEEDYERRFGGVGRLYTPAGAEAIRNASFTVVGLGGVGSWAAEALVRTAAEHLTLIDLDNVAESNTNRQIQALNGNFGKPNIDALAERFSRINSRCLVTGIEDFIDEENVSELLPQNSIVLDCIDHVRAKAAMIACCVSRGQPIITCGAAGGRSSPMLIQSSDLALAEGDPLLAKVRHLLRKKYGFPRRKKDNKPVKFKVTAVYSTEPIQAPSQECAVQTQGGLACAGYGSAVVVTGSVGFAAVAEALKLVCAPLN